MLKTMAYILVSLMLFTNTACAEDAKSAVSPITNPDGGNGGNGNGGNGNGDDDNSGLDGDKDGDSSHLELMALNYEGNDPFGTKCQMYLSINERADGHDVVAKFDYKIHGQSPLDSIVNFQLYDISTNSYHALDSTNPGTPVLVSAILKDASLPVDFNKLADYEKNFQLEQSLRVDLNNVDVASLEESMEEVIEDNSLFASKKAELDQLQRTVLKIFHNGHYDAVACSNFKLKAMAEVDFELNGKLDDDDDDHHHDDHHGDDHAGHDHD